MFIASRIEELLNNQKGLSKKAFCAKIGISVQGLDNILKGTEPGVNKLERILIFFKHLLIIFLIEKITPTVILATMSAVMVIKFPEI